MHGGKREGAGRKGYGKTKVYRLPIELDGEIQELLKKHKENYKAKKEKVTNSRKEYNSKYPTLNKEQLLKLQSIMVEYGYAKSKTQARKLTNTPKNCRKAFLEVIEDMSDEKYKKLSEIAELYIVD
jgi:transketolase